MKVKIKKLEDCVTIPKYATHGDAGMDLAATSRTITENFIEYGTGLALEIPEGFMGLIFPRSSISKMNLSLCNSVGIIDCGYRGELKVRFDRRDHDLDGKGYDIGDRMAQLIIMPFPKVNFEEVSELDETDRGAGGFGSTDIEEDEGTIARIYARNCVEL